MTDFKPFILDALDTMRLGELAAEGGKFKAIAYAKAIKALKGLPGPIVDVAAVKGLPGIGDKIHKKIEEIIATGGLAAAERMKEKTDVGAVKALLDVHGIGPVKAKALIKDGIKSIEELRAAAAKDPKLLTDAQILGLKYYEDGKERIPRAEMVRHEASLLSAIPATLKGAIVGSYRRGAADSGDVDMLVTYDPATTAKVATTAFQAFVKTLKDTGVILDTLVSGPKKWMGYIRLAGGKARRLDLLLTPPLEFGYAVLYFTGSDRFNVAMRAYANTKGLTLNEHGLKLEPKAGVAGVLPPVEDPLLTEEAIFAFLKLTYIPPTERVDGKQIIPIA